MNVGVHVFVWTNVFNYFGYLSTQGGIVESCGNFMFNSWGTTTLLSTVLVQFYIPTSMCLQFLHLLTNTCYFLCFYSFNTHFVVYLLGLRTVLGVGEEEEMRLRLLWRHRQKTVAAGDEWGEG